MSHFNGAFGTLLTPSGEIATCNVSSLDVHDSKCGNFKGKQIYSAKKMQNKNMWIYMMTKLQIR